MLLAFRRGNCLALRRLYATAAAVSPSADRNVRKIEKILIANRGEIACRVMQTARKMGIRTVAVYSDADRNSRHVQMADEAYYIGRPHPLESYLRQNKILEVAKRSGSQAIHPGYGFLSENANFASLCDQEDIIFIGPPPSAIVDMGIKSKAKAIMSAAGVPIVPGYHGEEQSDAVLKEQAKLIGYPVMIKAVLGGGGKGMRIARNESEIDSALESARREAKQAFNDDALLLERYVERPRHVEVQVFADAHGNAVYLYERDCSVQRRHQKIIEEAPAPGLTPENRKAIGEAGVRAALAVGYRGAGTVEFIMIPSTREFFFMEMNTRLQVEHPVSEMITGTDLVEWQIRVASNEPLPLRQEEIQMRGHAFEARIYAEDTDANFMPAPGNLRLLDVSNIETNSGESSTRIETGVRQGDDVSVYYDPMIAKLVVWAPDRSTALAKLAGHLGDFRVAGLPTNINFLLNLASHPAFKAGDVSTYFIDEHKEDLMPAVPSAPVHAIAKAAVGLMLKEAQEALLDSKDRRKDPSSPWASCYGFRSCHDLTRAFTLRLRDTDTRYRVEVTTTSSSVGKTSQNVALKLSCVVAVFGEDGQRQELPVTAQLDEDGTTLQAEVDGVSQRDAVAVFDDSVNVFTREGRFEFKADEPKFFGALSGVDEGASGMVSPMPGVVTRVEVVAGENVTKGQTLVVLIAMKMEYVIKSPSDGIVEKVFHKEGDNVTKGAELVRLKSD